MTYLTLRDLKALCEVDSLSDVIREHLRFRVSRMLASFELPGPTTLEVMKSSNTVISGSAALEIVIPGTCRPNDLNLYCPAGKSSEVIAHLLQCNYVQIGGAPSIHEVSAERSHHYYPARNGVRRLFRFSHDTHPYTLTLVESLSDSPLLPIFFFHSTYVMNYCSSTEIVSLYPEMTHDAKGLHNRSETFDFLHKRGSLRRWDDCGVELVWNCELWHTEHGGNGVTQFHLGECQRVVRSIHDGISLRIEYGDSSSSTCGPEVEWRLGFLAWQVRGAKHHDTQVLVTSEAATFRRYSNNRKSHRWLDWEKYWDLSNLNTKYPNEAGSEYFP
ncbi:hypothetical protein DFP72DRAFT_860415 [Ephemerocybe angulata]|uniref:Uncharacterized protein n=1 Tax=Ephemerocybe angulata TaxID=980116 RepID=A0A8H6HA81_9AGAR|nr:hypothetical protein DFP72DRAFT_860415 [Tulosesus angulatus]